MRLFLLLYFLSSCVNFSKIDPKFKKDVIKGGEFYLTTFSNIKNPLNPNYNIYIEGDGFIAHNNSIPSKNPTPRNKLVLALAAEDPAENVVYIARPCQFTPMELNPKCSDEYWTDKRWSKDSVDSVNEVIKKIAEDKNIHLIGFSGGGGVAILVAAINPDIKQITTLAGNLDHVMFNKIHKATQCKGSINPIDYATKVNHIPQVHIVGAYDDIVPESVTNSYISFSKNSIKIKCNKCTHSNSEWLYFWKKYLEKGDAESL